MAAALWFLLLQVAGRCPAQESGAPHVVGYELLRRAGDAAAGEVLLGELGCTACHEATAGQRSFLVPWRGPDLRAAVPLLRTAYLREFLNSPGHVEKGTTMPSLLTDLEGGDRQEAAEQLLHFLRSLPAPPSVPSVPSESPAPAQLGAGDPRRGAALFHGRGCVACHAPREKPWLATEDVELPAIRGPSASLGAPARKYTSTGLIRFLLDPLAVRPGGRMPSLGLGPREAADIASSLQGEGHGAAEPLPFRVDPGLAARGEKLFLARRCDACHALEGERRPRGPAPPAVDALDAGSPSGCLGDSPGGGAADYGLNDSQRTDLRGALRRLQASGARLRAAPTAAEGLRLSLVALGCVACHERDGVGGPEPGRRPYFQPVEELDLGDEGRFPPPLSGAGRKLLGEAIARIVRGQGAVRPYLATRMPDFGELHAERLRALFVTADRSGEPAPEPVVGRNRFGRELVGIDGLRCIQCHDVLGKRSLGVPGIDLATVAKRLRPGWFRDFLVDPAAYRPGSRMPTFWPEGRATLRSVLKGDSRQQLDAIWVYLQEIDQTRLPAGVEREGLFELVPAERPIVFRTFLEGVGTRAVAVGYPQKMHVAFDAGAVRFAIAWKGRFLDAAGTWDDRFAPFARSLGKDVIRLVPGAPIARLPSLEAAWPRDTGESAGYRLRGYRLDRRRVPIFLYDVEGLRVEERVAPDGDGWLERDLRIAGAGDAWWLRLGRAGSIVRGAEPGRYTLDERVVLEVLSPRGGEVRRSVDGAEELLLPIAVERGDMRVKVRCRW